MTDARPDVAEPARRATDTARLRSPGGRATRRAVGATVVLATAVALLAAALLVGVLVGPVRLHPSDIVGDLASHVPWLGVHRPLGPTDDAVLWQLRAPRVALGALVGGTLALSGAAYQGVFRNPLVDPYLLGVAAGAGLGATLAIVAGQPVVLGVATLPLAAFVGALGAVGAAWLLGSAPTRSGEAGSTASLLLAGLTIASFLTALQTFVQQRHADTLQVVYGWILGRLDGAEWADVRLLAPWAAASAVVLLATARRLDVLGVGDDEAASLGLHVGRVRLLVVVAATAGAAAAVSVSGLIGFVGIVVPHAVRRLVGAGHALLLPTSMLVGAAFLVLADVAARTALAPAELPIGVVTAFLGAPCFALLLRSARSGTA